MENTFEQPHYSYAYLYSTVVLFSEGDTCALQHEGLLCPKFSALGNSVLQPYTYQEVQDQVRHRN